MKPEKPITRKEMYLDVATGGSTELPSPVTREEKYLAKIAGESVDIPTPVTRYEMLLAAVAGESYTLTPVTRLEIYLAKAAGQDVEIPQPVTREEMYWFDYCGGTPTPPEREYTGAVPVTFIADGTPLLDYLISGNTTQSGTPTPDNPIIPQGTGERTGNLYSGTDISGLINNAYYKNDFVYANLNQGIYTLAFDLETSATDTYRSSIGVGTTGYSKDIQAQSNKTDGHFVFTFTIEAEDAGKNLYARFARFSTQVTITYTASNIMLNSGSTALPYEPYGYKIPISSANTTTPVYLGEVETTRRIRKYEFTGQENWNKGTYAFYSVMTGIAAYKSVLCTHYQYYEGSSSGAPIDSISTGSGGGMAVWIKTQNHSDTTIEQWKAYLAAQYTAGTPVTVWYVLATEETAVVNEPLMRIGGYADTLSMEQAGVQIPTVNGSNTFDVETTVKPSEVYIKYKGV